MSVGTEVRDSLDSSRYARVRRAFREGSPLEPRVAPIVAVCFFALAYFDGGTDPQVRAGAAIGLWLLVMLGLVLGLWPRAPIPRPALVLGMCLGGLAALAALSMTWADSNEDAFIAVVRVLAYLGLFVAVVLASAVDGARPWLEGLALGLGAVALVAVLSRLQPGLFAEAEAIRAEFGPARERLSFPTGYWNGLGACMALGIVLFGWLGADARSRLVRAGVCAVMPVAVLVLFLTSSRGAIVALAVGVVVLLALGRSRPVMAGSLALGGAAGALLVVAALGLAPTVVDGRLETAAARREGDVLLLVCVLIVAGVALLRFGAEWLAERGTVPRSAARITAITAVVLVGAALVGWTVTGGSGAAVSSAADRIAAACEPPGGEGGAVTSHLTSSSTSGRCQYWEVGFQAFARSPLTGIGAGGFEGYWAEHHTFPRPVSFAHSVFVTELAELGVGGLALTLGFFGVAAVAGVRARAAAASPSVPAAALAILAAGAFTATIDWMWEFPAVFAPVVVAAGLLTGPALYPLRAPQRSRFGFGVAALVVGWVTIVAALLAFFGQGKTDASEEALEEGDLQEAVDQANTATTLQPWAAEPYLLKAAALEADGELEGARDAVEAALDRAPSDARAWAVAARIEMAAGDIEEGLGLLSRANQLSPAVRPPRQDSP